MDAAQTKEPRTEEERRKMAVAIARDVIERLDRPAGMPTMANPGHYMFGPIPEGVDRAGDLQPHVDALGEDCTVCALGAVLLSKARLYNAVPVAALICRYHPVGMFGVTKDALVAHMDGIFDARTLDMIEAAFECATDLQTAPVRDDSACRQARDFGRRYADPVDRARAIMANIVAHDGDFVPTAADSAATPDA